MRALCGLFNNYHTLSDTPFNATHQNDLRIVLKVKEKFSFLSPKDQHYTFQMQKLATSKIQKMF